MRSGASTVLAACAVAAVIGGGMTLDAVGAVPVEDAGADTTTALSPESGAWYCAAGETVDNSAVRVVGAVSELGSTSAALRIDRFREGESTRLGEVEVFRGDVYTTTPIPPGVARVGVAARWWRTPSVVARAWEIDVAGEAGGVVEGPCEQEPSENWYLPGVSTVGGSRARLALANPFEADAAVDIEILTPEGATAPERLKNVGVPSRTVHVVDLNEYAPEESDLGAIVRVQAGRVVAEGWQTSDAAVGGIEGVSLTKLAPSAAETWTIPWFQGEGAESWVTVANVSDRAAAVNVTVHTEGGGSPPDGMEEIMVTSGAVQRIALSGVLPPDEPSGAVTVTSANGVPIVASATTRIGGESPARTGVSVQLGQVEPSSRWFITTAAGGERDEIVHLVNPGADPVEASLEILGLPDAASVPEDLQSVAVPPGAAVDVDITDFVADAGAHGVSVLATGGTLVAGMRASSPEGELRLVSHHAVNGDEWVGGETVPAVRFERGLARRIDTPFGPEATPEETPLPSPATLEPGTLQPLPESPTGTGSLPQTPVQTPSTPAVSPAPTDEPGG